ncbi:MAG: hypothetical protein J2P25_07330 [Nocardiopsaceae bacterium]|nr:hypothetical protein [Nocardiopsaceae bacterium]
MGLGLGLGLELVGLGVGVGVGLELVGLGLGDDEASGRVRPSSVAMTGALPPSRVPAACSELPAAGLLVPGTSMSLVAAELDVPEGVGVLVADDEDDGDGDVVEPELLGLGLEELGLALGLGLELVALGLGLALGLEELGLGVGEPLGLGLEEAVGLELPEPVVPEPEPVGLGLVGVELPEPVVPEPEPVGLVVGLPEAEEVGLVVGLPELGGGLVDVPVTGLHCWLVPRVPLVPLPPAASARACAVWPCACTASAGPTCGATARMAAEPSGSPAWPEAAAATMPKLDAETTRKPPAARLTAGRTCGKRMKACLCLLVACPERVFSSA